MFSRLKLGACEAFPNLGWSPLRSAGADQEGTTGQEFCRNTRAKVLPRRFACGVSAACVPHKAELRSQFSDNRPQNKAVNLYATRIFQWNRNEPTCRDTRETDVLLTPWEWFATNPLNPWDSLSSSPCFSQVKNLDTTVEDADLSLGRYWVDAAHVWIVVPLFARHDCDRCLIRCFFSCPPCHLRESASCGKWPQSKLKQSSQPVHRRTWGQRVCMSDTSIESEFKNGLGWWQICYIYIHNGYIYIYYVFIIIIVVVVVAAVIMYIIYYTLCNSI